MYFSGNNCSDYAYNTYMSAAVLAAVLPGATPAQVRRAPAAAGRRLLLLHLPPALSGRWGTGC